MSVDTKIQWCDSTVNPTMGCDGCELWHGQTKKCYAGVLHETRGKGQKGWASDFSKPKLFRGRMQSAAGYGDLRGQPRAAKPWLSGEPRMIFVSDMGDTFSHLNVVDERGRPVEGDDQLFNFLFDEVVTTALSANGQRHVWLWLTKRPGRFAAFTEWMEGIKSQQLPQNIWAGTSITGKQSYSRIDELCRVGHQRTIRFLSCEPLGESISLAGRLEGIDWVIVGGESGKRGTTVRFECDWMRQLRDECAAAKVAFFAKQLGTDVSDAGVGLKLKDAHGGDWNEWPADLRVRYVP